MEGRKITILCVGAPYIYNQMAALIRDTFYNAEFVTAHNYQTAVAALARHGSDIGALVTVTAFSNKSGSMSLKAGLELIKYVGANYPAIGMIALDTDGRSVVIDELNKAGAFVIAQRPLSGDLVTHIRTIMERAHRPQQSAPGGDGLALG